MHEHGLNTVTQRHGTRIAGPASTAQLQQDNTVLKAAELNVATVFLNGRPDPSVQKLLDHANHLVFLFLVGQRLRFATFLATLTSLGNGVHDRLARGHGLSDETEDLGLDVRPVRVGRLGYGDEVRPVKYRGDTVDIEQAGCQGRGVRRSEGRAGGQVFEEGGREILGEDTVIRDELQCLLVSAYKGQMLVLSLGSSCCCATGSLTSGFGVFSV